MRHLIHDSGEARELQNSQILGEDSPLEFDEDGRAGPLEDDVAEKLAAMHRHVEIEPAAPGPSDSAFDAEAFVDRTPMDDVVADVESGEYDERLAAIADAAERQGVLDAVGERRA